MKKVKTVIIGMGRMGKTRYEAMKRHGGYDVVIPPPEIVLLFLHSF